MRRTKEDLIKRIAEIEDQLRTLRFEVEDWNHQEQQEQDAQVAARRFFEIGDKVRIKNPRFGQDDTGTVIKANAETGWVSVQTSKGRVRRQHFNLILLRNYE